MRWGFWFRDLPATLVDAWFALYRIVLMFLVMVSVSLTFISLVLLAFGIRWGW